MSDNVTEKKSKISEEILRIADIVQKDLSIEEKGSTKVIVAKDDTFEKTLPEGQTVEMYKSFGEHLDNFAAGSTKAIGSFATEQVAKGVFNEADGVQSLDASISMWGKNHLEATYTKEITRVNVNPKNPEERVTTTKHGDMRVALKMNATANRGSFKAVRHEVADMASEAFAKSNK